MENELFEQTPVPKAYRKLVFPVVMSLSGINDFGRGSEFIPYPLQSYAQEYLGLNYPQALKDIYQEFGITFIYGELAEDPKGHDRLVEMIALLDPMPCHIMPVTAEKLAGMIGDAIVGRMD